MAQRKITYRSELKAIQLYYVESIEQWFWTPDGLGGYWYDTEAEAREDTGDEKAAIVIWELSDFE